MSFVPVSRSASSLSDRMFTPHRSRLSHLHIVLLLCSFCGIVAFGSTSLSAQTVGSIMVLPSNQSGHGQTVQMSPVVSDESSPAPFNIALSNANSSSLTVRPLAETVTPDIAYGGGTSVIYVSKGVNAFVLAFSLYDEQTCTAYTIAPSLPTAPTYGSVQFSTGPLTVGPGLPCAGDTIAAAFYISYTWTNTSPTSLVDFFSFFGSDANGDSFEWNVYPYLAAKNTGDCCNDPGSVGLGDPISIGSGNVFESATDYSTAGQNRLEYIRYYNSFPTSIASTINIYTTQNGVPTPTTIPVSAPFAGSLGGNWRSNYDRYLSIYSNNMVGAERADGQELIFTNNGSAWVSDTDADYTLTQTGTFTWSLTDHDDTVETYTTTASNPVDAFLQTITYRNGYSQTLAYNTAGQLASVTDSYNRSLTFNYNGAYLSSILTPDGTTISYVFNTTYGFLNQVIFSTTPSTLVSYGYYLQENGSGGFSCGSTCELGEIVDENGNVYENWEYDSAGRGIYNFSGSSANALSVQYNDADGSRVVTNAFGVQDTYSFSILQDTPKETQISRAATTTTAAATETFGYDANGYLNSQTDWNGNQTIYVNDSHGDPISMTEAAGSPVARTTTTTYDSTWVHLPSQIVTSGLTTAFTYDSAGEVLTKTLTDTTTQIAPYSTQGQTRTWTYSWNNALLGSVTSPRTDKTEKTSYAYTGAALTSITNPLGQVTNITANTGGGLPLTVVDANNVTTNFTYSPRQWLTSSTLVTTAGALTTGYGYDNAGNLTSITEPDGSELAYTYDTAHRLTATTDLFGQSIQLTLDALGDATATNTLNAGSATTNTHSNTFDALGRMLTDVGASNQTATYAYDANGNQTSVIDQLGNTTGNAFDALNRIQQITDPANGVTSETYDTHDRPLTITSPRGIVTNYVYDGFGDPIEETNPNTGATVYTYDNTGNLIQRVTAAGATTQYAYDTLDRVLTVTYPSDPAENVAYTYDQSGHGFGVGRLTSLTDAAGTLSRSYDERGNVLSETRTSGAVALTTGYTYDAASRIASIGYPSGALVSYTRDAMGRVTAITTTPKGGAATTVASGLSYEPFGPVTGMTFGNGVVQSRSYDEDYRLTALNDVGDRVIGGRSILRTLLRSLTYGYYPTNNIASITDLQTPSNTQNFNYDALQRLQSASGAYGSYQYGYDADSNRLSETQGTATTSYGYGAGSDLLASTSLGGVTTESFRYTADGRLATLAPGIGSPAGPAVTALDYNQAGQYAAAMSGSTALAGYTYDGFGQRAAKTISATAGARYVYNQGGMLLEETNAAGAAEADYIYLNGQPVAVLNGSTLYDLHTDHLGTPQFATNASQTKEWTFTYAPFGDSATASGTITQNLRLPGQYYDAETGWNHNGFRDYVPNFGRYLEPDPLGMQGSARLYSPAVGQFISPDLNGINDGVNFFSYVENDPLNLVDPAGADPCLNIDELDKWLDSHATPHYIKGVNGHCASNVRQGFEAGGLNTAGRPRDAKNYGPFLLSHGFSAVSPAGYQPQPGDTVVFQNYPGGNSSGHIEVWDGSRWVSDFLQSTNIYPGPGYRANQASHAIYRPTPCN